MKFYLYFKVAVFFLLPAMCLGQRVGIGSGVVIEKDSIALNELRDSATSIRIDVALEIQNNSTTDQFYATSEAQAAQAAANTYTNTREIAITSNYVAADAVVSSEIRDTAQSLRASIVAAAQGYRPFSTLVDANTYYAANVPTVDELFIVNADTEANSGYYTRLATGNIDRKDRGFGLRIEDEVRVLELQKQDVAIIPTYPLLPADAIPFNAFPTGTPIFSHGFLKVASESFYFNKISCRIWNEEPGAVITAKVFKTAKTAYTFDPTNLSGTDVLIQSFVFDGTFNNNPSKDTDLYLTSPLRVEQGETIFLDFASPNGSLIIMRTDLGGGNQVLQGFAAPPGYAAYYTLSGRFNTGFSMFNTLESLDNRIKEIESPEIKLLIPSTIYVAVGREFNLWKDNVTNVVDGVNDYILDFQNTTLDYTSNADNSGIFTEPRSLRMTPTVAGQTYNMRASLKTIDGTIVSTKKFRIITVAANAGTGTKTLIQVGDSKVELNDAETAKEFRVLAAANQGAIITQIGTKSATNGTKHEGYSGRTIGWFVSSASPFYLGGKLDFQQYAINQAVAQIDYVNVQLGANDIFQGVTNLTQVQFDGIVNNFKLFVDSLLSPTAGFPNCKIFVSIQDVGAFNGRTKASRPIHQYKRNLFRLNELLMATFEAGAYHPNVSVNPSYLWVDRTYSFPHVYQTVSARASAADSILIHTDVIHQSVNGDRQYADALFSHLKSKL